MRHTYPYFGIQTFVRAPSASLEDFAGGVAVIGVPWDGGVGYRPGARFGPNAIREVSCRYPLGEAGYYEIERGTTVLSEASLFDLGDVDVTVTDVEKTFAGIEAMVTQVIARGGAPLVLGGDHSITYPVVRGLGDRPLGVLQLDAHLDYMDTVGGARFTSSTVMRRVRELPQVRKLIQAGIRGLRTSPQAAADSSAHGNVVLPAYGLGVERLVELLDHGLEWYITLDLDVLDPSQAPGVSSPEPGGLTFLQVAEFLRGLRGQVRVVGCDLVELNPLVDPTGISAVAAANLAVLCAALFQTSRMGDSKDA